MSTSRIGTAFTPQCGKIGRACLASHSHYSGCTQHLHRYRRAWGPSQLTMKSASRQSVRVSAALAWPQLLPVTSTLGIWAALNFAAATGLWSERTRQAYLHALPLMHTCALPLLHSLYRLLSRLYCSMLMDMRAHGTPPRCDHDGTG